MVAMSLLLLSGGTLPVAVMAEPVPTAKQSKKKTSANKSKSSKQSKSSKGKRSSTKVETSAEAKRRQQAAQQDIALTREQIAKNEAEVKKNLNALGKLEGDIVEGKKHVAKSTAQVNALGKQIGQLQTDIDAGERQLERMRAEYLKAIKKVRAKRGSHSTLAFIFSSKNFNQAMRRMRYLKQFSDWRSAQSAAIGKKVNEQKDRRTRLAGARQMESRALAEKVKAQNALQTQYVKQDAIVVELKKNGSALRTHLQQKQAEANRLRNQVASLIAQEQARAEAQRKAEEQRRLEEERRAEQARRAEEARLVAEQRAAEDEARLAEERQRQQEAKAEQARAEQQRQVQAKKEQAKKEQAKKEQPKQKPKQPPKQQPKQPKQQPKQHSKPLPKPQKSEGVRETSPRRQGNSEYAEARRRMPRSNAAGSSTGSSSSAKNRGTAAVKGNGAAGSANVARTNAGGNFASMRGSLPRPVSGAFRVTSRFGRHSLPDMPDVQYDNPGIDAETAPGTSAVAVYGGKVSGVYMLDGFGTVVIVNHGGYYTVYGNLASASVRVGDSVKQGQVLGRVAAEDGDSSHGSIHFEVWRNREKLDPLGWIRG